MAVTEKGDPKSFPTFKKQAIDALDKYGFLALIVIVVTACNAYILWTARNYTELLHRQAEANLRIGNLEGKMEFMEKYLESSKSVVIK